MRIILFLIEKEILQISRDKAMLAVIFIIPLVQLLVLSNAATFELKKAPFHVVNFDQSELSRRLVQSFEATGIFELNVQSADVSRGIDDILNHKATFVMVIPDDCESRLGTNRPPEIQLLISAVDGNTASLIQSYSQGVLSKFNRDIAQDYSFVPYKSISEAGIRIIPLNRYNPELDYIIYMVPGIIAILVTLIGLLLSVLNIVREKEIGTAEQMNVTPIRKYQFIAGKLIPIWLLAMLNLMIGLLIAAFVFEVPFRGNTAIIFGTGAVYLLGIMGLGLFISTLADTQQQAMFIIFFVFMIFMLLGGIFTPIESMPAWAQKTTLLNPIAYFGKVMRMVMLKGSTWSDLYMEFGVLILMALTFLSASVISYSKRIS